MRGRVRAVLFDAGNTLLSTDYAALTAALQARGHEVAETELALRGARGVGKAFPRL